MKKIQLLGVILLALVGCQKVEDNNDESKLMSFIAGIEVPTEDLETRTILGGLSSDANRSVLWEYNDYVYVTNGTSYAKFTNQTEDTSDLAVLEGSIAQGTNYYAAYPYDMITGYSSAGFTIKLPAYQEYYKDGISSGSFPMVAQCEDGVFTFKNLCGILVLRLTGEKSVSSITFSGKDSDGNNMPVAGAGTVSMSYSDYPSMSLNSSLIYQATLSCGDGVSLNSTTPTSFHLVLPVGTYNGFELQIETTDGSKMVVNSDKSLNIKRSMRTTTAPLTYVDIIDLSSSGTANCYIVSNAGKYKFNASVKGNSTESIGSALSAEVLWESFGTDVAPYVGDIVRNATYKDGYIEFETPSTLAEGNAVIAAKDASGTILWSWHIWVTDPPEDRILLNNAGTMLDRNLGATSNIAGEVGSLGLLYQWGRKDPFLGTCSLTQAYEGSTAKSTTDKWVTSTGGSSPLNFIKNWQSYVSSDMWSTNKTMYDPCPAGYKVPDGGETINWIDNGFGEVISSEYGISITLDNQNSSWLPITSCRNSGTGVLSRDLAGFGSRKGKYWTNAFTNKYYAYEFYFYELSTSVTPKYVNVGSALAVRCVKEIPD